MEPRVSDKTVRHVLSTWAPRMIVQGVDYNDLVATASRIQTWDDWLPQWSATAALHEKRASEMEAEGRMQSAADAFFLAAMEYHFAANNSPSESDDFNRAVSARVECYRRAAPYFTPPAVYQQVNFEGVPLTGYLRIPAEARRPPVVVIVSGLESVKEEHHTMEEHFLRRGLATFSFDGPGQGETWAHSGLIVDFERAVSAVIDHVIELESVGDRVGIFGPSMGGYLGSRAAATDNRVSALAVAGASYDRWHMIDKLENPFDYARNAHIWRITDKAELAAKLRESTLEGMANQIECPLLIVAGTEDFVPLRHPQRLYEEASGPKTLVTLEGGNHICNNMPFIYRPMVSDFLAEHLLGS